MLESILHVDQMFFEFVNQSLSNPIFDLLLVPARNKLTWIPLYVFLVFLLARKYKWSALIYVLMAVVTIFISDTLSSKVIKKSVERPRPCHQMEKYPETQLRVHCGSGYSFTSSHATNHYAIAFFFLGIPLFNKMNWRVFFIVWAGIICLAQVYVGVHYPIDVISGGLLGAIIGKLTAHFTQRRLMKQQIV